MRALDKLSQQYGAYPLAAMYTINSLLEKMSDSIDHQQARNRSRGKERGYAVEQQVENLIVIFWRGTRSGAIKRRDLELGRRSRW